MDKDRLDRIINLVDVFKLPIEKRNLIIDSFLDTDAMYAELMNVGYPDPLDFPNATAYINALKPLPDDFINIVLKWQPKLKYGNTTMFLRESKNRYDGRVLIAIFNNGDANVKWQVCDTIAYNPPLYINDWIKGICLSDKYGYFETGLIPLAVAKMFHRDEARTILKDSFDLHPEVAPEALGKVGTVEDISFLEEKAEKKYESKFIYKEIEKAIRKIKKRAKV